MSDVTSVRALPDGVEMDLLVVPRASRERLGPEVGDRIKVAVTAPPVEGAANSAVIALLARRLRVARNAVRIVRGETGRRKTVHVTGRSASDVETALEEGA